MFKSLFEKVISSSPRQENNNFRKETEKIEVISENYGLPEIDSPDILRFISAIDFSSLPPEKVEAMIEKITNSHASSESPGSLAYVLTERAKDLKQGRDIQPQTLYGYHGMNRYYVAPDGRVSLLTGDNINPDNQAVKKARNLGMTVQ